jgi:hypothetical protein
VYREKCFAGNPSLNITVNGKFMCELNRFTSSEGNEWFKRGAAEFLRRSEISEKGEQLIVNDVKFCQAIIHTL